MNDNENKEQHESYGLAGFARISHSEATPLFGSSIKHRDTILLRLHTAYRKRDAWHERHYADKEIIEVEMSMSQFADLITSLNQGEGVPVTIRRLHGKGTGECPYINRNETHIDEFKELNDNVNANVLNLIKKLKTTFATKKTFTKADRDECLSDLTKIYNDLAPNATYKLKVFQEQMEQTVTEAKGEIEAFFENKMLSIAQQTLVQNVDELDKLTSKNPVDM